MSDLTQNQLAVLEHCPLFFHLNSQKLKHLLENKGTLECTIKGQHIYNTHVFDHKIGIVLSGSLEVYSTSSHEEVLLNKMTPGFIVGVAALFQNNTTYVTKVIASEPTVLYRLNQEEVESLMREDFQITKNYITFLSGRIEFLNKRIQTFTSSSAEEKLIHFLNWQKDDNGKVEIPMTKLANMLGVGRASLYRAIEDLIKKNVIEKNGQQLFVKNSAKTDSK